MTDIPDDVVEMALDVILERKKFKKGDLTIEECEYAREELRAAGRVFVEWERGECLRAAIDARPYVYNMETGAQADGADGVIAAIRSRTASTEGVT